MRHLLSAANVATVAPHGSARGSAPSGWRRNAGASVSWPSRRRRAAGPASRGSKRSRRGRRRPWQHGGAPGRKFVCVLCIWAKHTGIAFQNSDKHIPKYYYGRDPCQHVIQGTHVVLCLKVYFVLGETPTGRHETRRRRGKRGSGSGCCASGYRRSKASRPRPRAVRMQDPVRDSPRPLLRFLTPNARQQSWCRHHIHCHCAATRGTSPREERCCAVRRALHGRVWRACRCSMAHGVCWRAT